jgi:TatA/E family protein of Tat protein translocase
MPMGGLELVIILIIILLFFGARRVPELARSLGTERSESLEPNSPSQPTIIVSPRGEGALLSALGGLSVQKLRALLDLGDAFYRRLAAAPACP